MNQQKMEPTLDVDWFASGHFLDDLLRGNMGNT
jgi:hypothetical protein